MTFNSKEKENSEQSPLVFPGSYENNTLLRYALRGENISFTVKERL